MQEQIVHRFDVFRKQAHDVALPWVSGGVNLTANVRPGVRFRRYTGAARVPCRPLAPYAGAGREPRIARGVLPLRLADEGSFRAMPTDDILRSGTACRSGKKSASIFAPQTSFLQRRGKPAWVEDFRKRPRRFKKGVKAAE